MFGLTPYRNRGLTKSDDLLDFYDMMDDFFNDKLTPFRRMRDLSFRLDLKETDEEYVLEAELAGYKKGEIKIDFNDGRLTISVEKQDDMEKEDPGKYIHRERSYRSMQRGVYLNNVNGQGIKASFKDGVLEITVPKVHHEEKNSQIPIH